METDACLSFTSYKMPVFSLRFLANQAQPVYNHVEWEDQHRRNARLGAPFQMFQPFGAPFGVEPFTQNARFHVLTYDL